MQIRRFNAALAAMAMLAPVLASCAGSGTSALQLPSRAGTVPLAGARAPRVKSYMKNVDVLTRLTYIADARNSFVAVFGRNGQQIGTISDGLLVPVGLFVDGRRNLWVANNAAANVLEFPRGATSPSTILDDSGYTPYDVTICRNGTIYVSNQYAGSLAPGSISVYAPGSTQPTGLLQYPGEVYNDFVTCDAENNVFTTVDFASGSGVIEYPGGNQSGATQLPISVAMAGGIKLDDAGNLLVNDRELHTITEYTEAGVPTGNAIPTGKGDWVDIAVTKNSRVVLGADAFFVRGSSLTWPAGAYRQTYNSGQFGLPLGAAFDPGQKGI
ncbi:MAG: hypothetical protein ABI346_10585 [Candidatus Baltobacteraceae bacterium]